jgi:SAM-dependent methyltransferase
MHKNIRPLIVPIFLILTALLFSKQQSIEEWEKETFLKQPPEKVMDAAGIKPGMVIGEVGAGRGRFTVHLAKRVGEKGKILANDIDADALSYLKERCQKDGISNVEIILGEADDPHFPESALDMVFMVWTYHYFDQPITMLKKLRPSLKPGGTMVLVEPDPVDGPGGEDHGISPERMRQDAAEAGFEVVRIEDFLEWDLIFVLKIKEALPELKNPCSGQKSPGFEPVMRHEMAGF